MAGYYIPLVGTPQIGDSGGGGSGLPAVTAADNGDVLTVVNGAWDKATPSGGGVLVVNVNNGALDKTWQEIHDAGFAVTFGDGISGGYMICVAIYAEEGEYGVSFWTFGASEPMLFVASSATGYPQIGIV